MKTIVMIPTMTNADGKPWMIIEGERPEPRKAPLSEFIRAFVYGIPMQALTMEDAHHGRRVIEAVHKSEGKNPIELEDADYSWLVAQVEEHAARVFGINAAILREALGPTETRQARRAAGRKAH